MDRQQKNKLLPILFIAILIAVVYQTSIASLATQWQHSDHRHGVIVLPIVVYLLWHLRAPLSKAALRPYPAGFALMFILVAVWTLARLVGVQVVEHLALLLMFPAMILAVLGRDVTRTALFPLLFLMTALPVGDALVPVLMRITADVSTLLLELTGLPVYRQGQFISLPGGNFEVADVCSGMRYLAAGTIVALLFAYLNFERWPKRVMFVSVSAACLVIANGIRAFLVMWIASATELKYLTGKDHVYFGWIMFGVVVMLITYVGSRYADNPSEHADSTSPTPAGSRQDILLLIFVSGLVVVSMIARPFRNDIANTLVLISFVSVLMTVIALREVRRADEVRSQEAGGRVLGNPSVSVVIAIVFAIATLAAGPSAEYFVERRQAMLAEANEPRFTIEDCGNEAAWNRPWRPAFDSPDYEQMAIYDCGGQSTGLYSATYNSSSQGSELISGNHALIPDSWANRAQAGKSQFRNKAGEIVEVNELLIDQADYRSLIWYWYDVSGRVSASPSHIKLLQLSRIVQGKASGASIVLLEAILGEDPGDQRLEMASIAARVTGKQVL